MHLILWRASCVFPPNLIVVPIPKPGKDHPDSNNYRPIALNSCLCKTMERMKSKNQESKKSTLWQFSLIQKKPMILLGDLACLKDLYEMGFRGYLPIFISNFFIKQTVSCSNRNYFIEHTHTRIRCAARKYFFTYIVLVLKSAVLQMLLGQIYSVVYVDDLCTGYKGNNMNVIEITSTVHKQNI